MMHAQEQRSTSAGHAPVVESPDFSAGVAAFGQGDFDGAERHFARCMGTGLDGVVARNNLGIIALRRKHFDAAASYFREALELDHGFVDAWFNFGLVLTATEQFDKARIALGQAITLDPMRAPVWAAYGHLLSLMADHAAAETALRQALTIDPNCIAALKDMLVCLDAREDLAAALAVCRTLVAADPTAWESYLKLGQYLLLLERKGEAELAFAEALRLAEGDAAAIVIMGDYLFKSGRIEQAIAAFDVAIQTTPENIDLRMARSQAQTKLGNFQAALDDLKQAMELEPENAEVYTQLGNLFLHAEQPTLAIKFLTQAIMLKPDHAFAAYCLALAHSRIDDYETAAGALDYAIGIVPDNLTLRMELSWTRMMTCDWTALGDSLPRDLAASLRDGLAITPFKVMALGLSGLETLLWNRAWAQSTRGPERRQPMRRSSARGPRIRIGYVSADFRNHATAVLITEMLELHDRNRFEVFGYNIGRTDPGEHSSRIINALEHFVDISLLDDAEAARRIADDAIDILIDLKGYTHGSRTNIFGYRPAPIQVNYLGYPCSMGTPDIDYIVADETIIPGDHHELYDERVVILPNCYQPNIKSRIVRQRVTSRSQHGLPDQGFVFCCFNNTYKLTPLVFDIWMRLLREVPGSVLWLYANNAKAGDNLRREAAARGIDPTRLVFAATLGNAAHLERIAHADLFLDTLPVNAHTTASDALLAGVPVVTCLGNYFFGRVAGSLLRTVGLPELVAADLAAYEALALDLARDPKRLADLKARLQASYDTTPLFDTPRYTHNFEAALVRMMAIHKDGRPPEPFTVVEGEPLPELDLGSGAATTERPPFAGPFEQHAHRHCILLFTRAGYSHHQALTEIALGLSGAFSELGGSAPVVNTLAELGDRIPIVLGAHLMDEASAAALPPESVIFNLEQVGSTSKLLTPRYMALMEAHPVLDYSVHNVAALRSRGIGHARLLRLGGAEILKRVVPVADQDIDVLFYGSLNDRRRVVLAGLQARGVRIAHLFDVYGAERDAVIARARIVLNLHFYESAIFESARVVYLLANGACVVTEGRAADPDLAPFKDGLEVCAYDDLVERCVALLGDEKRRQALAQAGLQRVQAFRQADQLLGLFDPAQAPQA